MAAHQNLQRAVQRAISRSKMTEVWKAANPDLKFRSITDDDHDFLRSLYATTRAGEMAIVPWSDQEKDDFIDLQSKAQHTFYQEQFKKAQFDIISKNDVQTGRLYTGSPRPWFVAPE